MYMNVMFWKSYQIDIYFKMFIYKVKLQRQRKERKEKGRVWDRGIFHPLVYSPNGLKQEGWAKSKPGASPRYYIWVREVKPSHASLPGALARIGSQAANSHLIKHSIWDAGITDSGLSCHNTIPACRQPFYLIKIMGGRQSFLLKK